MRKTLLLVLLLLISAAWLQAQAGSEASTGNTIQGCLQSAKGQYTLTDSTGMVYRLSGQANKLKSHVGHEVELTGKPGTRTIGTTEQGAASSVKEIHVFHVMSIKHIADTCK